MITIQNPCLYLIISLIFFPLARSYSFNGYEIRDLESTTSSFLTEVQTWTVTSRLSSNNATQCGTTWLLGGYNIVTNGGTFSRNYTSLPSHNIVYFSMEIWAIDLQEQSDIFQLFFDNTLVKKWSTYNAGGATWQNAKLCGISNINDFYSMTYSGQVSHSASSLQFKIETLYQSGINQFSIGFRSLYLLFQTVSTPTTSVCDFSPTSGAVTSCLCAKGQYDPPGSAGCTACNSACDACIGPSASQCTACKTGASFTGTTCIQCDPSCDQCSGSTSSDCTKCSSGKYLYYNGTCKTTCPSPLQIATVGDIQYCNLPCATSEFLYQNNTCQATCTSPFTQVTQGNIKYCNFPCASPNYLYANGSCTTCASPYTTVIKGYERYCQLPCLAAQYYYQNGTCQATCASPFTQYVQGDLKYCNFPCASPNYLYANGSCTTCSSPYAPIVNGFERYCQLPCAASEYYYQNNTCQTACTSPFTQYVQGDLKYCNFPCASPNYLYANGSCTTCSSPYTPIANGFERYCQLPCISTEFYYQNTTCQATCTSPFTQYVQGDLKYCNFPCASPNYLYPNNTCSTCASPYTPFITGFERYCQLSCAASEFIYSNNTCNPNCPSPFTQSTSGSLNYCNFPCASPNYLYANGSCTTCSSPYTTVIQGVERYCQLPCAASEYYYQNNTCQTACTSLFTQYVQGDLKYCNFPCASPNYLYANGSCTTCSSPYTPIANGFERYCQLPCISTEFYYQNTTCQATCPSPFTQYVQGDLKYCNFPCTSPNYLYANGSCATCLSPYTPVINGFERYCQPPCAASEYLYPNNTCQAACQPPYVSQAAGEVTYCKFPCASSEYLYWNGSCLPTCPTSFQQIIGTDKYCKFYCSGGDYLYWNSTCSSSCNSPLIQTVDAESYKSCNLPCNSSQFLSPNSSCIQQCQYIQSVNGDGVAMCTYPCSTGNYLYDNQTCSLNCSAPFIIQIVDSNFALCQTPCPSNYYVNPDGSCTTSCVSPLTAFQSGILKYCATSSMATVVKDKSYYLGNTLSSVLDGMSAATTFMRGSVRSAFTTALVKLVKYIQYMNVPIQPDILGMLFDGTESVYSITTMITLQMPTGLEDQFTLQPLPSVFEEQGLHSSYIINHWASMSTYLSFFLAGLCSIILEIIFKKIGNKVAIAIMKRIKVIFQWNLLICIFFNTYDDLTLFAILEFRSVKFDNLAAVISFITCFVFTCLAVGLLIAILIVSRQALKTKAQTFDSNFTSPDILFYQKWQFIQVFYTGYKNASFLTQAYLFWFTLRIIIIYLIVGFLYMHPLIQTVQLLSLSILMIAYLLKVRPLHDPYSLFVSLVYEVLVLVTNLSLTLLTILDASGNLSSDLQLSLSKCILFMNAAIDFSGNIVMWCNIILALRGAYKTSKEYGLNGKTNWATALVVTYMNPGMDFHDLSNQEISTSSPVVKRHPRVSRISPQIQLVKQASEQNVDSLISIKSNPVESDLEILPKKRRLKLNPQSSINDQIIEASTSIRVSPNSRRISGRFGTRPRIDIESDALSVVSLRSVTSPLNSTIHMLRPKPEASPNSVFYTPGNFEEIALMKTNSNKATKFQESPTLESDTDNIDSKIASKKMVLEFPVSHSLRYSSNRHLNKEIYENRITETFEEVLHSERSERSGRLNEEREQNEPVKFNNTTRRNLRTKGMLEPEVSRVIQENPQKNKMQILRKSIRALQRTSIDNFEASPGTLEIPSDGERKTQQSLNKNLIPSIAIKRASEDQIGNLADNEDKASPKQRISTLFFANTQQTISKILKRRSTYTLKGMTRPSLQQ